MIVCHCRSISDQTIREAVREGAGSCRQVSRACKAGRSCGGCHPAIRQIIEEETASNVVFVEFDELATAS